MPEEREVKARLEIEREGDVDAFRETAEDVEQLDSSAAGADTGIDALKERIRKLKEEAKGAGGEVRESGKAVESFGSKAVSAVGTITAIAGAFTAGYAAGQKFRNMMNELTSGGFDQFIQKGLGVQALVDRIAGAQDSAADSAQRHQNNLNTLRRQGIDPIGLSAEEAAAKVEELARAEGVAAAQALEAAAAHERWLEKLGLSKDKLDELSGALAANIERFQAANENLSSSEIGQIFEQQIQSVLDAYARLAVEAPAALQALAAGWGITTSTAEAAAVKHKALVDRLREEILGVSVDTRESLEEVAAAVAEVLEGQNLNQLRLVDPEQFEAAKAALESLVERFRAAGEQIPAIIADAAAQTGIFVAAMEVAEQRASSFAPKAEEVAGSVGRVGEASARASEEIGRQTEETQALLEKYGETASAADQAATGVDQAADKFQAAGQKASEGAGGLSEQASAAGEAGQQLGQAASETESLATAQDRAKTSIEQTEAGINSLSGVLDNLRGSLAGIGSEVMAEFGAAQGFEQPILTGLDAIIAKAAQARAELQAVANVGTGAAPTEGGEE